MDLIRISLVISTLLCSLVAGLVFTFAVVVMPGIRSMDDEKFLQAFKAIDRVIQKGQPLFMIAWVGSAFAILVFAILAAGQLEDIDRILAIAAAALYLLGVQLPTMAVNVPLNNRLQAQDVTSMSDGDRKVVRDAFEPRWLRWNWIRTGCAVATTTLLIIVALRISLR